MGKNRDDVSNGVAGRKIAESKRFDAQADQLVLINFDGFLAIQLFLGHVVVVQVENCIR